MGVQALEEVIEKLNAHAMEEFPNECCGFLGSDEGHGIITKAIRCINVMDKLHEFNPIKFHRTAKTAFHVDSEEILNVFELAEEERWRIAGVYHSHTNGKSYMSKYDMIEIVGTPCKGVSSDDF